MSSDRHGYGIPGGYTDTGITGAGTDYLFGICGCTRTHIRQTRTRNGGFLVALQVTNYKLQINYYYYRIIMIM
jgi:hypothetical protein